MRVGIVTSTNGLQIINANEPLPLNFPEDKSFIVGIFGSTATDRDGLQECRRLRDRELTWLFHLAPYRYELVIARNEKCLHVRISDIGLCEAQLNF